MHPKFTAFIHFGTQFTPGKPKILLKTKASGKTTLLGVSHNISPRSQKNHRILEKLNSWAQIYKLPPQASTSGYFLILTLPRRNSKVFFSSVPHWAFFLGGEGGRGGEFGNNNSSKQRQIELNFWPQVVLIVVQMPFKGFWKTRIFTKNFSKYLKSWVFLVQLDPQFTSWKWPKSLSKWIKIEALFSFNFHWKP